MVFYSSKIYGPLLRGVCMCVLGIAFLSMGCTASSERPVVAAGAVNKGLLAYSVEEATSRLGAPDSVVKQGDGLTRHTWVYHTEVNVPPKEVRLLFGGGSFPSDHYRTIPGYQIREYCFFNIFTNDDGAIANITQEGNACELLGRYGNAGNNSLPPHSTE